MLGAACRRAIRIRDAVAGDELRAFAVANVLNASGICLCTALNRVILGPILSSILRSICGNVLAIGITFGSLNRLSSVGILEAATSLAVLELSPNPGTYPHAIQLGATRGGAVGVRDASARDELPAFAVANVFVASRVRPGSADSQGD